MIKNIVFDLDGTLLDTLEDLRDSVNHILGLHGYPGRTLEETRRFVGNGIPKLCERAAPDGIAKGELAGITAEVRAWYTEHSKIKTRPYDGMIDNVNELRLRGIRTAVVTNKAEPAAQKLCSEIFGDIFDAVIGDDGGPLKPDPANVRRAMAAMGAIQAQTVYVGDSEVDVRTAKNAGLRCIGVLWGFRDRRTLKIAGASVIIEKPDDLIPALEAF